MEIQEHLVFPVIYRSFPMIRLIRIFVSCDGAVDGAEDDGGDEYEQCTNAFRTQLSTSSLWCDFNADRMIFFWKNEHEPSIRIVCPHNGITIVSSTSGETK